MYGFDPYRKTLASNLFEDTNYMLRYVFIYIFSYILKAKPPKPAVTCTKSQLH